MNKLGREELLSLWWIFVLAIIGAGIVAGTLMFYSADISIKNIEADILAKRAADCLSTNGELNEKFLLDSFDFSNECGLAKNKFERGSVFFVKAGLYDKNGKLAKEIGAGDASFEKDCEIAHAVTARTYPKCASLHFNVNYDGNNGFIRIKAGSNNAGGRLLSR